MSKRAEEAALKAYPPTYTTVKRYAKRIQSELVDTHKPVRAIFQQGYEQAEKDVIERARELLSNYIFEDVTPEMISHFRKRIEEDNEQENKRKVFANLF